MNNNRKKIPFTTKEKKELRKFLMAIAGGNEEFEKIIDIIIENIHKTIYITYSQFVTYKEGEEIHNQTSDYNYCKLHSELRDEENVIKPGIKYRVFELKNGKFYSLISGLEYTGNLNDDCKLIKYNFTEKAKPN